MGTVTKSGIHNSIALLMLQSLILHLTDLFGAPCAAESLCMQPSIKMKTDLLTCWKNKIGEAILQEFDGREGYIYQLELYLVCPITLSMEIQCSDLHVLYSLKASAAIQLLAPDQPHPYVIAPQRARFFYLPTHLYQLKIAPGRTHIFGFYFQSRLFRNNNERPFKFLHPLIEAFRTGQTKSLSSIDFRIGDTTRNYIGHLSRNVKKGDLDSERHILDVLIALIKLARIKIFDEYERTSDPQELLKRCRQRIAQQIAETTQPVVLKSIAAQLQVRVEYLCRLHKKYYGTTLMDYRDTLLLKKINALLQQPYTLLDISARCGFNDDNALIRFFKKKTGITPNNRRNDLR